MENRQYRNKLGAILDTEVGRNVEWLMNISDEQRALLTNYLLDIDKTYRVDPDSDISRTVRQGVREIVEKIAEMIAERKPELKGHIIPKGSSHNGTKIGHSDEFDFVYQMDMDNFLKGQGTFKGLRDRIICVNIIPKPAVCVPATKPSHYVFQKYFCKKFDGEDWYLNTFKIKMLFRKVLCEVLSELELPPSWCHGGFNRPHFSGLRFLGPSHVLQFDYLATSDRTPLRISVDFVPMIKVQNISSLPDPEPLEACLKHETSLQYGWCSFHDKDYYYGPAEEMWLSNFSTQSTAKTVIRISKILHRLVKASAAKFPSKSDVSKIDSYMKDTTTGLDKSCKLQFTVLKRSGFVYVQDHFICYSDLNETTGDDSMLKSYYIKRLVMSMMFADKESQGREWTYDDLPDLVISIYMILHEAVIRPWPISTDKLNVILAVQEQFSVPLEEVERHREEKPLLPSHDEEVEGNREEKPLLPCQDEEVEGHREEKPLSPCQDEEVEGHREEKPLLPSQDEEVHGHREEKPLLPSQDEEVHGHREEKPLLPSHDEEVHGHREEKPLLPSQDEEVHGHREEKPLLPSQDEEVQGHREEKPLLPSQDEEVQGHREEKPLLPSQDEDSFYNYRKELSDFLKDREAGDELPVLKRFKSTPLITKPETPKFYHLLNKSHLKPDVVQYMKPRVRLLADSKVSAIFQLLRSVCEGKDSVDIVTLGLKTLNSSKFAQKKDFRELLDSLNP